MNTTNTHTSETTQPRDFVAFLLEQSQGKTNSELSAGLRDLAERVTETGKKGSITLTVSIEPMKDVDGPLIVTDKITLKLPEHDRIASVFYRGRDGNLTNRDPNQRSIFEVVDQTTGEVTD